MARPYTAWRMMLVLMRRPTYQVLVSCVCDYPGTNWTDACELKIDDCHKVIRLIAKVT